MTPQFLALFGKRPAPAPTGLLFGGKYFGGGGVHAALWQGGTFTALPDDDSQSSEVYRLGADDTAYGYVLDEVLGYRMATWTDGAVSYGDLLSSFVWSVSRDGQVWALQSDIEDGGIGPYNGIVDHGTFRAVATELEVIVLSKVSANGQWLTAWNGGGTVDAYLYDVATLSRTHLGADLFPGPVSDDGQTVAVTGTTGGTRGYASLWMPGGIELLYASVDAQVTDIAPDGNTACGYVELNGDFTNYRAFIWRRGEGPTLLDHFGADGVGNYATGLSDDGSVVLGNDDSGDNNGIVWTAGVPALLAVNAVPASVR